MTDKYYVYRPLLDLIGFTEGTDKGRGYNETLAYGKMLDGKVTKGKSPNVTLVKMTRKEIDKLQTKMLADPDNKKLKSSALGRYQEIRTTRRSIDKTLGRTGEELFDEAGQDEDACYLLGVRGIDKWLSGRLSDNTLLDNLAHEWASLPKAAGGGAYRGQNAAVLPGRVKEVLASVKKRHAEGQPKEQISVQIPVPVPTKNLDKPWYKDLMGQKEVVTTAAVPGITAIVGADWKTVAVVGVLCVLGGLGYYVIRKRDTAKQREAVAEVHAEAAEAVAQVATS